MYLEMKPILLPHVLSGGIAKPQVGRKSPTYISAGVQLRWYTLQIIESGHLTLSVDAAPPLEITSPAVLVLPPGHQYTLDIPPVTEYAWVEWGISSSPLVRRGKQEGGYRYRGKAQQPALDEMLGVSVPLQLSDTMYSASVRLCHRINGLWWRNERDWLEANHLLSLWLFRLQECYQTPSMDLPQASTHSDPVIQKFLEIADRHLDQPFTVNRWAEMAGVSRKTLTERLRNELGLTAKEAIDHFRLERSFQLLHHAHPIRAVASLCGFQSRTSFSRWFKEHTGLSPSEWRLVNAG